MTWQPITTFNLHDQEAVLLFWPYWSQEPVIGFLVNGVWWAERWLGDDAEDPGPTHWMPLPDNPKD